MAWGVMVKDVYLSRKRKIDLQDIYDENKDIIQNCEKQLLQLASATPRDRIDGDNFIERWELYVKNEVADIMEAICNAAGENFVIAQVLDRMEDAEDT